MKVLQIDAFGKPAEAVKLVEVPDVGPPAADEVVIALEASPINPSDLLLISGRYGHKPQLPSIVGAEGVGRVVAVGSNVKYLKEGDRTLIPYPHPTWAERIKTDATWLRPLPTGDLHQLAMLGINPATAYMMLTGFVTLPRGAWVIQNGANSGTGRALIAIAKSLGLKSVNVVRRPELVDDITAIGGDVVLVDGPDLSKRVAVETGKAPIHLAIDMVADTSTMNLMNCLADDGKVVSYSAMSGKPFVGPSTHLIFRNLSLHGFWLVRAFKTAKPEDLTAMYDHLAPLVASGAIMTPVTATYGFDRASQAIAEAAKFDGKVLFDLT